MKREPWQRRLERVGLSQVELAQLLGIHKDTISKQLTGKDALKPYVANFIRAWERLPQWARDEMWRLHGSVEDETAATDGVRVPNPAEVLEDDWRQRMVADVARAVMQPISSEDLAASRVTVDRLIAYQQGTGRNHRAKTEGTPEQPTSAPTSPAFVRASNRIEKLERVLFDMSERGRRYTVGSFADNMKIALDMLKAINADLADCDGAAQKAARAKLAKLAPAAADHPAIQATLTALVADAGQFADLARPSAKKHKQGA